MDDLPFAGDFRKTCISFLKSANWQKQKVLLTNKHDIYKQQQP